MQITRRTFILGGSALVAAPALAFASAPPAMPAALAHVAAGQPAPTGLRIHGWEPAVQGDDARWVAVGRGWRANWR